MNAILLWCALAAAPAPTTALERAAASAVDELAQRVPAPASALAIAVVSPETPELARATQTALVAAAATRGFRAVLPLRSSLETAEETARAAGSDVLLRLTVRVLGAEVTLAGDWLPTWVNFWAGRDPLRKAGGGAIATRATADAQVLTLAHLPLPSSPEKPPHGEIATRFALRTLTSIPERVIALAIGDLDGDKLAEIVALTPSQVVVLKPSGQIVARHPLASLPRAARPPREPAGALAIEVVEGKPRVLAFSFGRAKGEVLELQGGELKPVQGLDQPAACVGDAGAVRAQPLPGKNLFAAEVRVGTRSATLGFAPVAIAANPHAGAAAFVAVSPDGLASSLDAELKPNELNVGAIGAAVALGDLDGDGASELVVTGFTHSEDRARLLRLDDKGGVPLFESEALPVSLVAAAAGDLLGDGRDEAVLAGWAADGSSSLYVLGAQR